MAEWDTLEADTGVAQSSSVIVHGSARGSPLRAMYSEEDKTLMEEISATSCSTSRPCTISQGVKPRDQAVLSASVRPVTKRIGAATPYLTRLSLASGVAVSLDAYSQVASTSERPFHVYHVRVHILDDGNEESWVVYRRYTAFKRLSEAIADAHPAAQRPSRRLPSKLGLLGHSHDFLRTRSRELLQWLNAMVGLLFYSSWDVLLVFLTEAANSPPERMGTPVQTNETCKASVAVATGAAEYSRPFPAASSPMKSPRRASSSTSNIAVALSASSPSSAFSRPRTLLAPKPRNRIKAGIEDFDLLRVVGKGSFGKVMLVRWRTTERPHGKLYAMKVLNKRGMIKRNQVRRIKVERGVLEQADCPFIAQLACSFRTETHLYLVQTYCPGGELYFHMERKFVSIRDLLERLVVLDCLRTKYRCESASRPHDAGLGRLSPRMARFYAAECALAIRYLHSIGIVYRDLKPENIMLAANGHVMLVDFGLAKWGVTHPAHGAMSFVGTTEYLAPEMIKRCGHGQAVDWWSLGMVLYEMLTGLPPWYSENRRAVTRGILQGTLRFPSSMHPSARAIIIALLKRNPEKRLGSINGFIDIRNHSYFKSMDWASLEDRTAKAPFVPNFSDPYDTRHFDKRFTSLAVHPCASARPSEEEESKLCPQSHRCHDSAEDDPFDGFSFDRSDSPISVAGLHND